MHHLFISIVALLGLFVAPSLAAAQDLVLKRVMLSSGGLGHFEYEATVEGDATLELSTAGDIRAATLSLEIGHGSLRLPALPEAPLEVDGGTIKVAYDAAAQRVLLSPSTLRWRGSRITMSGAMQSQGPKDGHPVWSYDLSANEGEFAAAEFAVAPVKLQSWRATGRVLPHRGEIEVGDHACAVGDALQSIVVKGDDCPVARDLRIRLQVAIAQGDRGLERRQRVLGCVARSSAMSEADGGRTIEEGMWAHRV